MGQVRLEGIVRQCLPNLSDECLEHFPCTIANLCIYFVLTIWSLLQHGTKQGGFNTNGNSLWWRLRFSSYYNQNGSTCNILLFFPCHFIHRFKLYFCLPFILLFPYLFQPQCQFLSWIFPILSFLFLNHHPCPCSHLTILFSNPSRTAVVFKVWFLS